MKRRRFCLLALILLTILSGCRQSTAEKRKDGLWAGEELEMYLSQFGVPLEEVKENLGLSENDLTEGKHGEWNFTKNREINGLDFSRTLSVFPEGTDYDGKGFDWNGFNHTETVYRMDFTYLGKADENSSIDQLLEKGMAFAIQIKEAYGVPSTYPGIEQRVFDEEGNLKGEKYNSYREEWQLSEGITANLSIYCDDQGIMLQLTYMPDIVQEYALFKRTNEIKEDGEG